ncbi:hypothetical protein SAMN05421874_12465 [Nonomuraea maritima]|jgi:hypothetical protein|uniref:Uncharacterized protein n=1 Tax=Nonomuraea maritima TaxID=683260 RepID=A0A1G9L844_9ACTN|nr:hypothetical protein SAMN05421874_12465 [Nonomuraea maritima]
MTTRPYPPGPTAVMKRPAEGRAAGNDAVPEKKLCPREAVCRKDYTVA